MRPTLVERHRVMWPTPEGQVQVTLSKYVWTRQHVMRVIVTFPRLHIIRPLSRALTLLDHWMEQKGL